MKHCAIRAHSRSFFLTAALYCTNAVFLDNPIAKIQRISICLSQPILTMFAFTLSKPISLRATDSFVYRKPLRQNKTLGDLSKGGSLHPTCQATLPRIKLSRRSIIALLAAYAVSPVLQKARAERLKVEPYDANKSRRHVPQGRPGPDRPIPSFSANKPVFSIDEQLSAQDVKTGTGEFVEKGTLVSARWLAVLEDGTTVDDTNEIQPALFRPGAHQVPPGIEDAIVGMQVGGVRRVAGTSERILSNISTGYDIGERSLVPTGSTMYIDIFVDRVNPFGTGR